MNPNRWTKLLYGLAPVVLTIVSAMLILLVAGANPFVAMGHLLGGAFESPRKLADIAVAMVPLLLCSAGMLITFASGLMNIGVEGQMVAGALLCTWAIKSISAPSTILLPITILAGMLGGALWGVLIGLMRTYGHVSEIFAGLGLNYVAAALTNYLIFGPWRPPDGATMSGTDPFPPEAWMPSLAGSRASLVPILLAAAAIIVVYILLRDSYWGLRLKAIGLNGRSAQHMGIDTTGHIILAFVVCGTMAGLAGAIQATAVYHRLIPSISGGYGYLAQLVVLLAGLRPQVVPLVVLFFSAVQVASPRLELRLQLDSSIAGVLQASAVLFFLLVRGFRQRWQARKERAS